MALASVSHILQMALQGVYLRGHMMPGAVLQRTVPIKTVAPTGMIHSFAYRVMLKMVQATVGCRGAMMSAIPLQGMHAMGMTTGFAEYALHTLMRPWRSLKLKMLLSGSSGPP